jgi:hypothetical protein
MFPATTTRVSDHTSDSSNQRIKADTDQRIRKLSTAGRAAINTRLQELDYEWDIERVLEANAASVTLVGSILGLTVDRRWMFLPAAVGAFLLQHATQGWCPPMLWLRRMGVRTQSEIDHERYALKAIRGDFRSITSDEPSAAIAAARQ